MNEAEDRGGVTPPLAEWTVERLLTAEGVREAREALGVTQAQLAAWLGMSDRRHVSMLEVGRRGHTRRVAYLLHALLWGWRPPC